MEEENKVIEENEVKKNENEGNKSMKKKNESRNGVGVVLIFSIFLSFVCGMLGAYLISKNVTATQVIKNITTSELVENSISSSVDKVWYSTVAVIVNANGKDTPMGTGFVYKKDGKKAYILTNHHVVDGVKDVKVEFNGTSKRIDAKIVGSEKYSDIAVLSIPDSDEIKAVEIGDNETLKLGDTVFTVGMPVSIDYKGTVTKGILSGKDRLISVAVNNSGVADYYMRVIQIDAAINPGNSGGPLCDVSGKVIGITSIKIVIDSVEGMGFAIPIEDALKYAKAIETGGEVLRPYIGVSMAEISNEYLLWQNKIMVPDGVDEGVVIISVEDGAAKNAGIQKGDVILSIGGEKVTSVANFRYQLYRHDVGEKVEFEYFRDKKVYKTTVTLGKQK